MNSKHKGQYWLISVPHRGTPGNYESSGSSTEYVRTVLSTVADVYDFSTPTLRTGTLENLMKSADALEKVDQVVEQVVRKVERQFSEIGNQDDNLYEVDEEPVLQYIETFRWDFAKFPVDRQIDELVKSVTAQATRLEDELRESSYFLQEKKQSFSLLQKKKSGNLAAIDMTEVITPRLLADVDLVDSEYLKDIFLAVPKGSEKEFLATYDNLASTTAEYKSLETADLTKGSPVAPFSAQKLKTGKEYVLYAIRILKKYENEVKMDASSHRYVIRDFDLADVVLDAEEKCAPSSGHMEEEEDEASGNQLREAEQEMTQIVQQMRRWCKANYGEMIRAWIHLKAIRVFVESCLRYGIPPNFASALVEPRKGHQKKARKLLEEKFAELDASGLMKATKEEVVNAQGEELFPYVSLNLSVFGND